MTYGFRPDNWPAFQAELERRGITAAEIERVEIRPIAAASSPGTVDVNVTLRSGRTEAWRQPGPEAA